MAFEAASANLSIGLKNAVDLIPDVVDVMQFAVNEQCHQYDGECALYKPFTDQNKAVFNIEYGGSDCSSPDGVKLSIVIKSEDQALNALGGACKGQGIGTSQGAPKPSMSKVASVPSKTAVGTITAVPSKTTVATGTAVPIVSAPAPTATGTDDGDDGDDEDEGDDEHWGWGWWSGRHHHHD